MNITIGERLRPVNIAALRRHGLRASVPFIGRLGAREMTACLCLSIASWAFAAETAPTCEANVVVVAPAPALASVVDALRGRLGERASVAGIAGGELKTDDALAAAIASNGTASGRRLLVVAVDQEQEWRPKALEGREPGLRLVRSTRSRVEADTDASLLEVCASASAPSVAAHHEEVIVTGSRFERPLVHAPYSVSLIDADRIAQSGADSAGEVLRDVPGVQLTDTSLAGGKRPRIRGEVGSNVLVLVDGREVSEQRSFHGAAPLLVDLGEVEKVEVVRGPSSVVYGSKAIGGTVNYISRGPSPEPFSGRAAYTFNSATGGYDAGASVSGSLPLFDYLVSASRSEHGDRRVPDEVSDNLAYTGAEGRLENSAFDTSYLTAEVGRRVGAGRLSLRYEDFRSSLESHTSDDVIEEGLDSFQLDLPQQDRRTLALGYAAASLPGSVKGLSVNLYHTRRDRVFDQTLSLSQPGFAGPGSLLEIGMALGTVYEQRTTGVLTSLQWAPGPRHWIVAGIDLLRDEMNAETSDATTTRMTFPGRPPRTIVEAEAHRNDTRQDSAGLYVQDDLSLSEAWKVVLGARYNAYSSELLSTTNANLAPGSSSTGRLSAAVSLLYQPSAQTSYRASYSQGYRHPSLLELWEGTAHGGGGLLFPNPDLDPETSDNYEVGLRFTSGGFRLDGSAFYTRARDYVTTRLCGPDAPCPESALPGTDRVYDNVDGATTLGAEFTAEYALGSLPLTVFSDVALIRREFESPTLTTTKTGLASLTGRAGVRWDVYRASGRRYSAELFVRAGSSAEEEVSPGSVVRYAGWGVVSARLGARLAPTLPLSISVEVGNLFDKAYVPAQESLFQPGRHVVARVSTEF